MQLNHKNILITGGAQGLGRAMAMHLASKGANIALLDLASATLNDAVQRCQQVSPKGTVSLALSADVTDETQVASAIRHATTTLGPLNGLINNAGILRDGLLVKAKDGQVLDTLSLDQWQSVINVNLTGVFLCGRAVAAHMITAGTAGVIINITSVAQAGHFGQSSYAAAKAGVAALTVTWAQELAPHGIRCAGIAPGVMATDMVRNLKPDAQARLKAGIPLGRLGQPEEVANAAAFILENDYVNGRILALDGGLRF